MRSEGDDIGVQVLAIAHRPRLPRALRGDLVLRVELAIVGAIPIVCLALSVLEIVPLHIGGSVMIATGILACLATMAVAPELGRQALGGYLAGLIAVLVYDGTRLPFVVFGGWPDFIPKIGAWLLDTSGSHWSVGYAWRYLGNGAGMGLTFTMLVPYVDRWVDRRVSGVVYGVTIWTGLVTTLLAAPAGQDKLFQLTPLTIAVSLTGHLVYGAVLGALTRRWADRPPVTSPGWRPPG